MADASAQMDRINLHGGKRLFCSAGLVKFAKTFEIKVRKSIQP
jgi:hypothetical protein